MVYGTSTYLFRISLASDRITFSSIFLASSSAARSPDSLASRRVLYRSPGNLESMGRYTVPFSAGRRTANSTRSLLPGTVATLVSYCSGARISSRMAPNWISPRIPRVLTPDRTFFSPPTSPARLCISPSPRYTCSSCSLTVRNDSVMRFSSAVCSFSSTVPRISSSLIRFSSRMAVMASARDARS